MFRRGGAWRNCNSHLARPAPAEKLQFSLGTANARGEIAVLIGSPLTIAAAYSSLLLYLKRTISIISKSRNLKCRCSL